MAAIIFYDRFAARLFALWQHGGTAVSTAASQQEGPAFACSPHVEFLKDTPAIRAPAIALDPTHQAVDLR